jgi:hypothetical protein
MVRLVDLFHSFQSVFHLALSQECHDFVTLLSLPRGYLDYGH